MPLVDCPSCGHKKSVAAPVCPYCGSLTATLAELKTPSAGFGRWPLLMLLGLGSLATLAWLLS